LLFEPSKGEELRGGTSGRNVFGKMLPSGPAVSGLGLFGSLGY